MYMGEQKHTSRKGKATGLTPKNVPYKFGDPIAPFLSFQAPTAKPGKLAPLPIVAASRTQGAFPIPLPAVPQSAGVYTSMNRPFNVTSSSYVHPTNYDFPGQGVQMPEAQQRPVMEAYTMTGWPLDGIGNIWERTRDNPYDPNNEYQLGDIWSDIGAGFQSIAQQSGNIIKAVASPGVQILPSMTGYSQGQLPPGIYAQSLPPGVSPNNPYATTQPFYVPPQIPYWPILVFGGGAVLLALLLSR